MPNTIDTTIRKLFEQLDRWRHLPAYRLEPRADPFFALYLHEVVSAHVGADLHEVMIPELPLRRGTLWGEATQSPNKSVKVDYALASRDGSVFYLLELKTDSASRRDGQDAYLERAAALGLHAIVDGVLGIAAASHPRYAQKYLHLLHDLGRLGLVEIAPILYEHAFPNVAAGIGGRLGQVRNLVASPATRVHVLYLQPSVDSRYDSIGFEEFAAVVERHGDALSLEFASTLRRWSSVAGASDPRVLTAPKLLRPE